MTKAFDSGAFDDVAFDADVTSTGLAGFSIDFSADHAKFKMRCLLTLILGFILGVFHA